MDVRSDKIRNEHNKNGANIQAIYRIHVMRTKEEHIVRRMLYAEHKPGKHRQFCLGGHRPRISRAHV